MRIILDHSVPNKVRTFFPSDTVETAYERGWSALKNGELLKAIAADGFQVFVTADQNLRHQQNLSSIPFGVVVLGTNLWPVIAADPGRLVDVVVSMPAGSVSFVDYPRPPRTLAHAPDR